MKLYSSKSRQVAQNKYYPHKKEIHSSDDLAEVVAYDHVAASFKDNCRGNANFIQSDCSMFDVDNTHSDNPTEWVTPADLQEAFPGVGFYVCYSRNHMKAKGDKAPRPKFHVYFPDRVFDGGEEYAAHKQRVCAYFTAFDPNAKDAARFFFGVECPQVEYFNGDILLYDFMKTIPIGKQDSKAHGNREIIPQGSRNTTMRRFALSKLTHLGDASGEAYQLFLQEATKCVPLLEDKELDSIWKGAMKFYCSTVKVDPNYIAPENYEKFSVNQNFELPIADKESFDMLCKARKQTTILSIEALRYLLKAFGITVRLNDMNHKMEVTGLPSKYNVEDACNLLGTLIVDIASALSFKRVHEPTVHNILNVLANKNHYHPVLELLDAEPWDGQDRLSEVYKMLCLENELDRVLVHKWALQTVALLHNTDDAPVAAQGVLVLQGAQGIGKTQFFKHLAIHSNFFKEGATLDMNNKDSTMSATKVWMCELGEIDATTKKEQSALKAFLTRHNDHFREPYARHETIRLRRTSFCGTVNPKEYLRDETGNRRFWTVSLSKIDLERVFAHDPEWYAQFWRQMHCEYKNDPKCYLLSQQEQSDMAVHNTEYETARYGEDEFLTCFDLGADASMWKWCTAAEITDRLNSRFKGLHLRSQSIGKLLARISGLMDVEFQKKTVKGKRLILCPPAGDTTSSISSESYRITPPSAHIPETEEGQEVVF